MKTKNDAKMHTRLLQAYSIEGPFAANLWAKLLVALFKYIH